MAERTRERSYYDLEDDPIIAAVSNAQRYSVEFSREVCEVKITGLKDERKMVRELFSPSNAKKDESQQQELLLQTA